MYRKNRKFLAGFILLACFILLSFIGPLVAPYEEDYSKSIGYIQTEKGEQMTSPPFPPSKEFIFGTDKWGYDLLTLMLHGAKYTVIGTILIALSRVILGGLTGIISGLRKGAEKPSRTSIPIFSSIPSFIIIYFIMIGININPIIPEWGLIMIQSMLMIILGVSGVHNVISLKTIEVKKEQYILASESFGAQKKHLMVKHIFPALKDNLFIILVNEAILVLHLIGQLGIFNLFFGGTTQHFNPPVFLSITHEWSGLIGQARGYMYLSQWIVLFPILAYILFLSSLYLISTGLNEIQRSNTRKDSLL
ncbi:ABC transporter permease [Bacillus sp. CGMCC 1.16607]|uniref:ABC transporter permease n=1 Tax=Bacillus sp. CGMCC 1.16607 TaxID=3351842 RepID=UPI0036392F3A